MGLVSRKPVGTSDSFKKGQASHQELAGLAGDYEGWRPERTKRKIEPRTFLPGKGGGRGRRRGKKAERG